MLELAIAGVATGFLGLVVAVVAVSLVARLLSRRNDELTDILVAALRPEVLQARREHEQRVAEIEESGKREDRLRDAFVDNSGKDPLQQDQF